MTITYLMDNSELSIERLLDHITPEILGIFNIDSEFLNPDKNNFIRSHGNFMANFLPQVYPYLPSKPIIKILTEIREENSDQPSDTFGSIGDAIFNIVKCNKKVCHYWHNKFPELTITNNKVKCHLNKIGDTLEAIVIDDITKIKNIKIVIEDSSGVVYDSLNKLDYTKTKEYRIHYPSTESTSKDIKEYDMRGTVKGLLISDYNIPLISTTFHKMYMELEFEQNYVLAKDELMFVYTIINKNYFEILRSMYYELDMQPGRFIIFGSGMCAEHFTGNYDMTKQYQDGTLDPTRKELFDLAHKESARRKTLT